MLPVLSSESHVARSGVVLGAWCCCPGFSVTVDYVALHWRWPCCPPRMAMLPACAPGSHVAKLGAFGFGVVFLWLGR